MAFATRGLSEIELDALRTELQETCACNLPTRLVKLSDIAKLIEPLGLTLDEVQFFPRSAVQVRLVVC